MIASNVSYVKKVVFPLEILPLSALGSALFHLMISFMIWILFYVIKYHSMPPWTMIYLPVILLPLIFFMISAIWFLSATGVYLRDLQHAMTLLMSVMIFITPVFYPLSAVPKQYQFWYYLNPLTFVIEEARNVLIFNKMPDWMNLFCFSIAYIFLIVLSFNWFQTAKKGFADVI